jgi:hypothetical protein
LLAAGRHTKDMETSQLRRDFGRHNHGAKMFRKSVVAKHFVRNQAATKLFAGSTAV